MFLGSKVRRVRKADNLTTSMSRLSRQCGILNMSQLYRPSGPVTGIASVIIRMQRLGKYVIGGTYTYTTLEELLIAPCSVRPVSYRRKYEISSSKKFLFKIKELD
jgi:hypothetical protein